MAYAPLPQDYYFTAHEQYLQEHHMQQRAQQQHHHHHQPHPQERFYLQQAQGHAFQHQLQFPNLPQPSYSQPPLAYPPYTVPLQYSPVQYPQQSPATTADPDPVMPRKHHKPRQSQVQRDPESSPPSQTPNPPSDQTPDPVYNLNLKVLRTHLPSVTKILLVIPICVVYTFSNETQSWEKIGKEGTLFVVCQDENADSSGSSNRERYTIIILNRKGPDNFILGLHPQADHADDPDTDGAAVSAGVQVEGEYIILSGSHDAKEDEAQVTAATVPDEPPIYGLWIFEEAGKSTEGKKTQLAEMLRWCLRQSRRRSDIAHAPSSSGAGGPDLMSLLKPDGGMVDEEGFKKVDAEEVVFSDPEEGWMRVEGRGDGEQGGAVAGPDVLGRLFRDARRKIGQ